MAITPDIQQVADEIGLNLNDKHPETLKKLEALQNLKLEVLDSTKPWHGIVTIDKSFAENQISSDKQKIDHIILDNANVAKLAADLHSIFPDNGDVSYANRYLTLILGKHSGVEDLPNTNAGLGLEDDFRGALLKGQIKRDEKTGNLTLPITRDTLYQLTQAAGESPPTKINELSDISGTRIFTWGDSKYEAHIKAPQGEYRQIDASHLPLSKGAIGFLVKRDGMDLPLSTDGKPVDFFTGTAPSANNKDEDLKAFVIDQVSALKPYEKGKDAKLDADIASAKPKAVLVDIEGTKYAVASKDLGNIRMTDGKPTLFWEPKVVFVDEKDPNAAETAREIYTQTYLKDKNSPDYKDPNKRIGDIAEFKNRESFNKWFDEPNKNQHAGQWISDHPDTGKVYVLDAGGKPIEAKMPEAVSATPVEKGGLHSQSVIDAMKQFRKNASISLPGDGNINVTSPAIIAVVGKIKGKSNDGQFI